MTGRYEVRRAPLRAIVDEELRDGMLFEVLECGHKQLGKNDPVEGLPTAERRRCWRCALQSRFAVPFELIEGGDQP